MESNIQELGRANTQQPTLAGDVSLQEMGGRQVVVNSNASLPQSPVVEGDSATPRFVIEKGVADFSKNDHLKFGAMVDCLKSAGPVNQVLLPKCAEAWTEFIWNGNECILTDSLLSSLLSQMPRVEKFCLINCYDVTLTNVTLPKSITSLYLDSTRIQASRLVKALNEEIKDLAEIYVKMCGPYDLSKAECHHLKKISFINTSSEIPCHYVPGKGMVSEVRDYIVGPRIIHDEPVSIGSIVGNYKSAEADGV